MKKIVKIAVGISLVASCLMAGGPDSALEVSPEFGGSNILKVGYQTYKMKIEGVEVQDFFDANDFYLGSKFSLMSDDFAETYLAWKVGFTLNDVDGQDDIFHAGLNLGYSSIVSEDSEDFGYFMQIGLEYFDGSSSETIYNADIGINYKLAESAYITPFVGMVSDDNFDEIKGEGGALFTYRATDNAAVSLKYTYNKWQMAATLNLSYVF